MSPEYAMQGQFSVKSDAYSFGVLLLEIISGQRNSNFYQTDGAEDLISYVSIIRPIIYLFLALLIQISLSPREGKKD